MTRVTDLGTKLILVTYLNSAYCARFLRLFPFVLSSVMPEVVGAAILSSWDQAEFGIAPVLVRPSGTDVAEIHGNSTVSI